MTRLQPMSADAYATWRASTIPAYAQDKVESGHWAEDESLAKSEAEFDELLPHGLQTADHWLYSMIADGPDHTDVGMLWIAARPRAGRQIAYIYDIEVWAPFHRQGHATSALRAIEEEVRGMGLEGLELHVFGHNHAAQALYEKLGFAATSIVMFKPLTAAP